MVYATLSGKMVDLLRSMIGNELVSYECAVQNNEIYGNLRINTSGGAVEVVMTGAHEMKAITIDPDAVDPDDVETLQDMIIVAVNDVLGQITEESGKLMGGMGMGF